MPDDVEKLLEDFCRVVHSAHITRVRSQGFHHPSECTHARRWRTIVESHGLPGENWTGTDEEKTIASGPAGCPMCRPELAPWEDLDPHGKRSLMAMLRPLADREAQMRRRGLIKDA
jgi:hypothetical protein